MEVFLIMGGILAAVGVMVYVGYTVEKARTERFRAVADELGMRFHPKGDPSVLGELGQLRLFSQGRGRKARNMIVGRTEDVDMAIFGYQYTVGGGKNSRTYRQTVVSFRSPNLALPDFELRPEHLFHKIGQAFGYKDIDIDSHPEFSKQYLLRGQDEISIREVFTAEVAGFFESQQRVSVEATDDRLIYYRAGKRIKPEDVRTFMEEGFRVYGLFRRTER